MPRLQVGYSAKMNLLLFAMIFDLKIRAQGGFLKKSGLHLSNTNKENFY